nr:hypothetical protein [uncultured Novosphingobium sp.]
MKIPPMSAVLLHMAALAPLIPAAVIAGPVLAQEEPAPVRSVAAVAAEKIQVALPNGAIRNQAPRPD